MGRAASEEVWREIPGCRGKKGGLGEEDAGRAGTSPGESGFRAPSGGEGDREPAEVLGRAGRDWRSQRKSDAAPAPPPDTLLQRAAPPLCPRVAPAASWATEKPV